MTRLSKENSKLKILATAESLFAQQGFDATGIDQIAKTAGITKSLIYYYFKSKDEILAEIFQNFIKKSIETKIEISRTVSSLGERKFSLESILKEHTLPFLMKHQDIIKIAFAESLKETSATPHINIFRYFDQNFQAGLALAPNIETRFDKTLFNLGGFFLFWVPLFSFVIFSDEWCEYYHCDLPTATDLFVKSYALMYNSLVNLRPEDIDQTQLPGESDPNKP
jgi:AcrR family transcriptional regulator